MSAVTIFCPAVNSPKTARILSNMARTFTAPHYICMFMMLVNAAMALSRTAVVSSVAIAASLLAIMYDVMSASDPVAACVARSSACAWSCCNASMPRVNAVPKSPALACAPEVAEDTVSAAAPDTAGSGEIDGTTNAHLSSVVHMSAMVDVLLPELQSLLVRVGCAGHNC